MNFNDIEISVYNGVRDTHGHRSTLAEFLNNADTAAIEELRASADPERRRRIKMSLPQATVSGVFAPTRSAQNLVRHSGLICVDIDRKDNLHVTNYDTLTDDLFSRLNEVAYCARSVSGAGYFLIIPLKYPERHKEQFARIAKDFADMGLTVDRACGDVCRLRCQSYDPHPYVNADATPYPGILLQPRRLPRPLPYGGIAGDDEEKVAAMCRELARRRIDITASYADWVKTGAALTALGERGRKWFHLCSSLNSAYNPASCDRKYDNLLRTTRSIGLGTFFHACRMAGISNDILSASG